MPTAGGARDCWRFIDAVCATAVAAVTTICEGVTRAGDKPVVAASM
jgi:anti-sigma-K factor RskA